MAVTKSARERRRQALAAATTLLGIPPAAQAATPAPAAPASSMEFDTSFLYYHESGRMTVMEPQFSLRKETGENRAVSILLTVDTISGATPLGTLPATANTAPNTVTNASGHPVNSVVGRIPTEDINDVRVGLNASWERPWTDHGSAIYGVSAGHERDFLTAGANLLINRDFNQKNTTLSFGVAPELDRINPNGGLPMSFGNVLSPGTLQDRTDTKYLVSALAGLTQVLSRRLLMQWNYGFTYENGYLNDPYKQISLVNANGDPVNTLYERRPGKRIEQSLYWLTRYSLRQADVFSLGLRFYGDDWGIHSQTLDFTYRWQYHAQRFLEPHVRYYHQGKADFFHVGLRDGQPLPDFASADYRLADIDGVTFGVRWGWTLKNQSELLLRAEYYTQTGESRPSEAVGVQRNYDLFPTLHATILQIEYRFQPQRVFGKKAR